jgi:lysine 2,3-aminomutase
MQEMGRRKIKFRHLEPWPGVTAQEWRDWKWQLRKSLKTQEDFSRYYDLTPEEVAGFTGADQMFRVQTTPYYASLSDNQDVNDPIRRMILPHEKEMVPGLQQMLDPLGERKQSNRAAQRLIHRYTDRALFLATDVCGVYCRYCTRKHFTASDQVMATDEQLDEAVTYVKATQKLKR